MGGQPQDADRSSNAELLALQREAQMRRAAEHWIEREAKARQERDEARETIRRIGQIVDGAIRCADQAGYLQCLREVDWVVRKAQPQERSMNDAERPKPACHVCKDERTLFNNVLQQNVPCPFCAAPLVQP